VQPPPAGHGHQPTLGRINQWPTRPIPHPHQPAAPHCLAAWRPSLAPRRRCRAADPPPRQSGWPGAVAALPTGADPVLVLWRQYNDLLCRQEPISDSADTLRAILTARWGEANHATPALIFWGHDPRHAELRRLITEYDCLGYLIADTRNAMVDTPALSVPGLRANIQLAIGLYPTDPDSLEAAEYQDWFAMAVLRDADRLPAIRGEAVA
jgi:hypothetical protein